MTENDYHVDDVIVCRSDEGSHGHTSDCGGDAEVEGQEEHYSSRMHVCDRVGREVSYVERLHRGRDEQRTVCAKR